MRIILIAVMLLLLAIPASATAIQYSSKDAFLAAVEAPYLFENFSQYAYGELVAQSLAVEKENYLVVLSAAHRLFSGDGNMSINCANDLLIIDFSSSLIENHSPITAFGANFWPTDFSGHNLVGPIKVTLSDGSVYQSETAYNGAFVGFISADGSAFQTIEVTVPARPGDPYSWPTLDNLYAGSVQNHMGGDNPPIPNPEPSSLLLLGTGICGIGIVVRNAKK